MAKKAGKNTSMAALGRLGGKKGGPARAKTLTSGERKAIAAKGGAAKAKKAGGMKKSKKAC